MQLIEEIQPHALLQAFRGHHQYCYIKQALSMRHCYRVLLYGGGFDAILINSALESTSLPLSEYPTLRSVIDRIKNCPDFLKSTRSDGGLSGVRVKELYDGFVQSPGDALRDFFLVDSFPEMGDRAPFYVLDGMHRLVAYGLATGMCASRFPIVGFYCTDTWRVMTPKPGPDAYASPHEEDEP